MLKTPDNRTGERRHFACEIACFTARATIFAVIFAFIAGLGAPSRAAAQNAAAPPGGDGVHLGVASCAGSNCHGATQPTKGSSVRQDEYLVWSQETDAHRIDSHHQAYTVLLGDRALRIAHNLGLPDAVSADICLNCHADNVPKDRRGLEFRISDGVGCEACHGGASTWLGVHLSGAGHKANLAAGLYPTEQPRARAERCLSCHLGDEAQAMTHRIMAAGHPRLTFELDTFTAIEPAHFVVDKSYIERKGPVNGVQVWAVGQAVDLVKRMDGLLAAKRATEGIFPEPVLFDCQSCHHPYNSLRGEGYGATGLAPGSVRLNDAAAVMLRVIAARVAPAAATSLSEHVLALHRATAEGWGAVRREASQVRTAANALIPVVEGHDFTQADMKALADGVMAAAITGEDVDYPSAEQAAMALDTLVAAMRSSGHVTDDSMNGINDALGEAYRSLANDETYRPKAFVGALRDLQKAVPP